MKLSRLYEDALELAYWEGKRPVFNMANGPVPGEMHLSKGQEPCAVGVCEHLGEADVVSATHRPHHVAIAKGVDLKKMTAEIFGRSSGLAGGRGGHMHLFDKAVNFSCSGIVGQGLGPTVGSALAKKMDGTDSVAVCFIGEGAANQGMFHEALNLASVWRVPAVFVIEDNSYGISVGKSACTAIERNADRAAAYGMPGRYVAGNDPDVIFEVAGEQIARARAGHGPSLLEIQTHRYAGHFLGDTDEYRPAGQLDEIKLADPIISYRSALIDADVDASVLDGIDIDQNRIVAEVFDFARNGDAPAPDDAYQWIFSDELAK